MRQLSRASLAGSLALVLAAAAACKSPTQPEPAGITVLSPAMSDTVGALLSQALVVQVRDSAGNLSPGVSVRFQSQTATLKGFAIPVVLLSASTPDYFQGAVEATTDATGRAAVRVRLGQLAAVASVDISVPTLGLAATAPVTVHPGAAVGLAVAPADSAVYVDGSYTLRPAVVDRWGNAVPGHTLTVTSDAPAVAGASGTSISGKAIGRARLSVSGAGMQGEAFVSVVPRGQLLAARQDGVYEFGLDGSGYRRVAAAQQARSPRWFPDGQGFVFSVGLSHAYVSDLAGSTRRLAPGSGLQAELWAHPSADGWVYFGGYSDFSFRGYPYRVRPDGTDLQLVPGFKPDDMTQGHPSPSPDGTRVAYFREEGDSRNVTVRVLDMSTGTVSAGVSGHSPEWSHGDSIAYQDMRGGEAGPIRLMSSAGQGHRMVGTGQSYGFGIDWSPGDQWIVARDVQQGRLEIINVSTGLRIPLPYSAALYDPAWKP